MAPCNVAFPIGNFHPDRTVLPDRSARRTRIISSSIAVKNSCSPVVGCKQAKNTFLRRDEHPRISLRDHEIPHHPGIRVGHFELARHGVVHWHLAVQ